MSVTQTKRRISMSLLTAVTGGAVFQLFPSCERILTTVNPCGTILGFCDPTEIDLLFSEIPNYDLDPTCTVPGYGYSVAVTGGDNSGNCATSPVYPTSNGERPR